MAEPQLLYKRRIFPSTQPNIWPDVFKIRCYNRTYILLIRTAQDTYHHDHWISAHR